MDKKYGYFLPSETSCKCGCGLDIKPELRDRLNRIRFDFGEPLVVVSGRRCHKHNEKVGGVPQSLHLVGLAADIRWPSSSKAKIRLLASILRTGKVGGLGIYSRFVHVDLRHKINHPQAMWHGR